MMPAATHFDPVVGVDVHMVQPSGPVPPVPIPHPYIGIVFDPFDYLPIIGSTVKVNGLHRAIAGTAGKALPKHFPIGGTFVPPLPADEHENFMGSSTVEMDGDAAAYMALPCLSCQSIGMPPPLRRNPKKKTRIESLVLPTSLVLPIPKGAPVLVGGAPTISLTNVALHLLGPLARAIRRSKPFRKGAQAFGKARRRAFRNMKPGFLKCRILRAEPVDVVTGEVVVDQQDFELPGRIPIRWTRHYRSGSARRGICGVGWETPADARLELGGAGVVFHDGAGVATYFDALPDAEAVVEPVDGGRLHRLDRHFVVEQKGGLGWYFEIPHASAAEIRVSAIVDGCRNSLHFLRDSDGLREVVESAGRRLVCTSERGLLRQITLHHPDFPERRTLVRFAYDDADNLTAVHDALDHPYSFGWDHRHRLLRHTNRTGLSFHYEYDADSRCVHSWGDGRLHDYHFEYDPVGRFTNLTDSLGHPWTVEYDERLLITRETDPLGGVTSYAYDEVGRTVAVVDPAGRMTAYAYDDRGNLIELTRPDGTTIASEFDWDNRPIRIADPNGAVWEYRWNERGLLVERRSPLGAVSRYTYDPGGQLACVTDPRGAATHVGLDAFGNLAVLTDALGSVTRFQHDALGNVTTQVDPLGCRTVCEYDAKGQLAKVLLPTGATISCAYSPRGELTHYMDENGAVTLLAFAGQGRIRRRVRPDGSSVEYHYDSEERLIGVTNERGETYHLEHDALGQIIKEIDYWGQVRLYTYDAAGHLRQSVDPLGRVIRYATDPLGRVRKKVLPHPEQPDATFEETYDFDANGYLVRAANPHIAITRRFDAEGRLLEEVQGSFAIRNTYDPNGNRVRRETSAGNRMVFEYDALDHVCAIRINDELPILIQRDQRGQIIREAFGRGLVRRYGYDAIGRQTEQAVARSGEALFAVSFDYDAGGNLTRRSDSRHGSDRYRYDPLGRVMDHADSRGRLARFLHDPSGDRLVTDVRERAAPPGVAAETASSVDRWAREGDYDGRSYRFDRAGNLAFRSSRANPDRPPTEAVTTCFSWDANQRLLQSETNGICTRYGYDALGRRTFKETNGRRTSFYWDGDALVAEDACDVSEPAANQAVRFARVREYLYYPATFSPLALIDGSASRSRVYHYHTDPNGCPTRLTDETGEAAWSAAYGVWGTVITVHAGELSNPIRLQGQYEDSETSLHYNRHRYFDHNIGQFVGQDPLRLRPSDNIYEFGPNAFQWADPLGLAQHRVVYWWERPSTGEWDIGREFSGLNPGHKRKLSYVEQTDTHTEHLILRGLEDRVQPGDIITIMGTEPPCGRPRNGRRAMTEWCYDRMEGFADWHDVEIRYIVPQTGSMWRFRRQPPPDCGR